MRCAKVVGVLVLAVLTWALWAGAHQETLQLRDRVATGGSVAGFAAKGDTIYYTGFEPGDPLGTNVDYNSGSSPDQWHVTRQMLYQGTTTWMTAPADSYFCHIGDDSLGYSDGDEVGYQIELDLTNYSDVRLYYLSAMQAYSNDDFDKFVVWGTNEAMGENWVNLDPGPGVAWGGDWEPYWYEPEGDTLISLVDLEGHAGVIVEFWFLSDAGHAQGFGVGIDEIIITGTPTTPVESMESGRSLPGEFALDDPYPNPFNAQVSIGYRIPEAEIQLNIYNVRGQLVKTLTQGFMAAGDYMVTWAGRDEGGQDVDSGVYFCQLRCGDVSVTRKVVLLR